jgi:transcriptional regulator with XRE-family HTH domain
MGTLAQPACGGASAARRPAPAGKASDIVVAMSRLAQDRPRTPTVGDLLRSWRRRRGVSQLDLALEADSSARHISFIESGRARPSRDILIRLAERLDVPVRERNALLTAAGYAPLYPHVPLDDPGMTSVRSGLDQLMTAHLPNPALVLDGLYDVVASNRAVGVLIGEDVAPELLRPPLNAMRLTLHPQGLAPRIRNLPEWRAHLLERMLRQLGVRPAPALRALYDEVSAYQLPDEQAAPGHPDEPLPFALPLRIDVGGRVLSFVSTLTTFNTPLDVTVSELAVEAFLPLDEETSHALRELSQAWER